MHWKQTEFNSTHPNFCTLKYQTQRQMPLARYKKKQEIYLPSELKICAIWSPQKKHLIEERGKRVKNMNKTTLSLFKYFL